MKTYYQTSQATVLFDPILNVGIASDTPRHTEVLAEVQQGAAQILPWPTPTYADKRRVAYEYAHLSTFGWLEAVVEFLGTLPNPPEKFAARWAVREQIRAEIPKPNEG